MECLEGKTKGGVRRIKRCCSVAKSCPTLCNPMDCSTPGFYVLYYLPAYMHAKLLQSCLTLCDPMDYSLPGSSVHGILQARTLEWVAMPFSRGSSLPRDWICLFQLLRWQLGSLPLMPLGKPPVSPRVSSNSCPLSQWCYLTISSSAALFFCHQSFLTSGSFSMSQLFASGGQSIGASASASVLPMDIHGWFPLGLNGLTSLLSKGLSTISSSTTVQKHQFFSFQLSLWSNSHIHT